jgi:hypothetical protein
MKKLKLLLLSIITSLFFTGCWPGFMIAAALEPAAEKDWANKAHLERLMNNSKKQLLTEREKQKVSKSICSLKNKKESYIDTLYGGPGFCNLDLEDKIYFLKEITSSTGLIETSYLLVKKNIPIDSAEIKRKYSKEEGKNIPIIERLH